MKILILSESFMGMAESYRYAFISQGYDCVVLFHEDLINGDDIFSKSIYYLRRRCKEYRNNEILKSIHEYSEAVIRFCDQHKPDIVLDILGQNIDLDCVKRIKENAYVVKYMLDLVENYPYLKDTLQYYNKVYTYETYDIPNIEALGVKKAELLYATYDQNKYHCIESPKAIDVSFVGKMFTKEQYRRFDILNSLVKSKPDLRYGIYGVVAKPYQVIRYIKWLVKDHGKLFRNHNITADKVNELYNESRICININSYQTHNTWSSRLLEMMATGTLTLTEATRDTEQYLGKGIVLYANENELYEKIDFYLQQPEQANIIGRQGAEIAKRYTMETTVMRIIKDYSNGCVESDDRSL